MNRSRWILLAAALLLAWQAWHQLALPPRQTEPSAVVASVPALGIHSGPDAAGTVSGGESRSSSLADGLPPEVQDTLRRIVDGGPFPSERDGVVFGNFERRLPLMPSGYYHEYTVPTPGLNHRGARRVVTGGNPPESFYYTDNRYQSFRKIGGLP